jgi:predicted metalloprotease
MGGNANTFWKRQFARAGLRYTPAAQLIVEDGKTASSACRPARSKRGPFYCEYDRPPTAYLTHTWFETRAKPLGDFAMAFIVAHEWGHHIQNVLGLFRIQTRYPRLISNRHIELMADCLAGVWAKAVYHQGLLEPGDVEEAVALAAELADRPTTSPRDPSAHGGAIERTTWFKRGYDLGRTASCKTWSGDPPSPVTVGNARSGS